MLSLLETYLPLDLDRARCLLEKTPRRNDVPRPGRCLWTPQQTIFDSAITLGPHATSHNWGSQLGVPEPRLVSQTYCFFPVRDIYIHIVTSQSPGSLLSQSYKSIRREG